MLEPIYNFLSPAYLDKGDLLSMNVYDLLYFVLAGLAKRCYIVLAGLVPAGHTATCPLYIHNPCSVCNYDTHLVFCVHASFGIYLFPCPASPLQGFRFLSVLPRYRLPCRPSDVRLRSVTSCPRPAVALLKERYRVLYRARVFITSRGRCVRAEFPPQKRGELLPSVNGSSLSSRACKTDFRPCLMTRAHIGKPPLDCFSSSATSRPPFSIALDFGQVLPLVDYFGSKVGAYKKPCRVSAEP